MLEKEALNGGVESLAKEIVDYMIAEGTENTSSGSWCIYFDEINERFGTNLPEDWAMHNAIVDEICEHREKEVADFSTDNDVFDFVFYLDYCPNYSSWPGEGMS